MSLTLTYHFANHDELAAHIAQLSGVKQPAVKEVAAPAAPKPEKTKPPAVSPAPAAEPTPQASETAKPASLPASTPSAESGVLSYDADIKPLVIKVGATKGRDAVVAILGTFNAAKGTDVGADDLPAFKAALEHALKG
jgi:hypothetical protein